MPEKYRHFLRITLPLIVTVVGIVMTLFAYRFLDSSERNGQEQRFNSLASAAVESIQQKISQYSFVLDAAQALYASSDYIDKSEWRIFSQISHFSSLREIKETGVIVPVDTDKIPAFLKDTIKSGHASFQIKSHSKAQRLLIKKYVEPERESHKIGEDLSDNANIITICDLSQKKRCDGFDGNTPSPEERDSRNHPHFRHPSPPEASPLFKCNHKKQPRWMGLYSGFHERFDELGWRGICPLREYGYFYSH